MDASEKIALVSLAITTIVAVVVPFLAFQFAVRQEKVRWLREQRAQYYVDLLAEAYAEKQHLEYELADEETREHMSANYVDLRLPQAERAKLGARGNVLGAAAVNRAFNRIQAIAFQSTLSPHAGLVDPITRRMRLEGALEDLQAAIQKDLGTEHDVLPASENRP